jgi:hypothetical protein
MRRLPNKFDVVFGAYLFACCLGLAVWAFAEGNILRGIGAVIAAAIAGPGRAAQRRRQSG